MIVSVADPRYMFGRSVFCLRDFRTLDQFAGSLGTNCGGLVFAW